MEWEVELSVISIAVYFHCLSLKVCVRQGENRDFDTYKEVKKYENIIIEKVVKSFYGGFVVSLIKKGICPKFKIWPKDITVPIV